MTTTETECADGQTFYADSDHRWATNENPNRPLAGDRCLNCGGARWGDRAVGPTCRPRHE